jgi:3-deoxy-D-manno-octulosonate 8-phosphate phosphatase (KDO 8-P phosphatase)
MGDDINDLPAMRIAGYSAAPSNASRHVLSFVKFVATSSGGNGAVREFLEALLDARGQDIQTVFAQNQS